MINFKLNYNRIVFINLRKYLTRFEYKYFYINSKDYNFEGVSSDSKFIFCSECISSSYVWQDTKQGHSFWAIVCGKLKNKQFNIYNIEKSNKIKNEN